MRTLGVIGPMRMGSVMTSPSFADILPWQGWQHGQLQQPTQECEMAQDFDPHILATMTEEERASILEEQSPEEKAAIVAIDTGRKRAG